jgi:hypothetical protein
MVQRIGVMLALALAAIRPSGAQTPVSARAASTMTGVVVVVEDTVAEAVRPQGAGSYYLNFGRPFPHQVLSVLIPRGAGFPDVSLWATRRVRVRGTVVVGFDGPVIACSDPAQLQLLDWVAPAAITPATSPTAAPTPARPPAQAQPQRTCCRVCSAGKPCGNTCIAANRTCRQPPGCAC